MVRTARHPLTPEHRAEFQAALDKWQVALSLSDWRIVLLPKHAGRGCMADVEIDYPARLARVRLARSSRNALEPGELESFALHELLHIRLADLVHVVEQGAAADVIEANEHAIIVIVDKLLRGTQGNV